jgi:hypothetical protein
MAVRLVFRCQFCGAQPDADTRRCLEDELLDFEWGCFTDAEPAGWLVWHGKGIYGPTRYSCAACRIKLRDFVRRHYGTVGWHPHAMVVGDVPRHVRDQLAAKRPPRGGQRTDEQRRRRLRLGGGFAI